MVYLNIVADHVHSFIATIYPPTATSSMMMHRVSVQKLF